MTWEIDMEIYGNDAKGKIGHVRKMTNHHGYIMILYDGDIKDHMISYVMHPFDQFISVHQCASMFHLKRK